MMTLMSNLKFRLLWIYTTNRPSKFYTIYSARLARKCFVEWNCLALILSKKKIVMTCILLYMNLKINFLKWCWLNSHWDVNCLFHCQISNKKISVIYQVIYNFLSDDLLKLNPAFVFFPHYAAQLLDLSTP